MCPAAFVLLLLAALNSVWGLSQHKQMTLYKSNGGVQLRYRGLLEDNNTKESTGAPANNSTGLRFFIVFPENIAYYHPDQPTNKVHITALYPDTRIHMKPHTFGNRTLTLSAGETKEVIFNAGLELTKSGVSDKMVTITSNKRIAVQAISLKNISMQTALVMPAEKLGTRYLVPPAPPVKGTAPPGTMVTAQVTERSPFSLFIVSPDVDNVVTLSGAASSTVSLQPNQVAQILLHQNEAFRVVTAENPVAVLFSHPCALQSNCTCGLLYAMLRPDKDEALTFFIPPALAGEEASVLLSQTESSRIQAFDPTSPVVKIAGSAVLYRPGLLVTLIPETDFGGCYFVSAIANGTNSAVIVVDKDFTDGVHVGSQPLQDVPWQPLTGTKYVSTVIQLVSGTTAIWHASSKMAVYYEGTNEDSLFGNPAAIISATPDPKGCTLTADVVEIGEVADGWRESLKYCDDKGMELLSLPEADFQKHIHTTLTQANVDSVETAWIGMRRSSQSGEWYWVNEEAVSKTNWEEGEPGTVKDGHCAVMNLKNSKDFGWSDEDCCEATRPVCYAQPVYFDLTTLDTSK